MILLVLAMLLNIGAMFYLDRIPKSPLALKYRSILPTVSIALTVAWFVAFGIVLVLAGVLPPIVKNGGAMRHADDDVAE